MRISIVTGTFHPEAGGPPRYLLRLSSSLVQRGHQIRLATYGEPSDHRYLFPVTRISRRQPTAIRLAKLTWLAHRDMRGADLVFANDYGLPPLVANSIHHHPLVLKIVSDFSWEYGVRHGMVPEATTIEDFQRAPLPRRLALVRAVQSRYARAADVIIVPSKYLARIVSGWGVDPSRLRIIYNATERPASLPSRVEARARVGLPPDARVIVTVARLVPWKGVRTLIRAHALLHTRGLDARLLVVGDGEERPALELFARQLGVAHLIRFEGEVSQEAVSDYLRAANAFALASTYEGLSHVLLEALAAETPAVATSVGGNVEVLSDGESGLLVPPDDPDALAAALECILEREELAARLVQGARAALDRFTWDRLLNQTEALFLEMCERKHSDAGAR